MKPLSYIKNMAMLKNATLLITDSGGMQKEAFYCNTPCLTVREETEWPETIKFGINKLVSPKNFFIYQNAIKYINLVKNKKKILNVYGFGNASIQILKKIKLFKK
jgi:UDP-N-acetylglucosamine 2-epimerase